MFITIASSEQYPTIPIAPGLKPGVASIRRGHVALGLQRRQPVPPERKPERALCVNLHLGRVRGDLRKRKVGELLGLLVELHQRVVDSVLDPQVVIRVGHDLVWVPVLERQVVLFHCVRGRVDHRQAIPEVLNRPDLASRIDIEPAGRIRGRIVRPIRSFLVIHENAPRAGGRGPDLDSPHAVR